MATGLASCRTGRADSSTCIGTWQANKGVKLAGTILHAHRGPSVLLHDDLDCARNGVQLTLDPLGRLWFQCK
jgi:hypothetical protein